MKEIKLPKEILIAIDEAKIKIADTEQQNLKLKLNLAQFQISLLQGLSEIEVNKSLTQGMIKGFAISKKINFDDIKLSEDGLSIITND